MNVNLRDEKQMLEDERCDKMTLSEHIAITVILIVLVAPWVIGVLWITGVLQ